MFSAVQHYCSFYLKKTEYDRYVRGKFTLIMFIMIQKQKSTKWKKLFNVIFIYNINLILIHMTQINIKNM